MKWCEVFKAGKHTDANGNTKDWSTEDLDKIVAKFNEKKPQVPCVIGHPKVDNPAYGWVENFKREGQSLYAAYKSVVPQFAEWVNNGLYPNRSISLYEDLTPRHIGFLGAVPPAVKGLEPYQFSEDDNCIIYEFAEARDYKFLDIAEILSRLRDFLIEKYDLDTADKIISAYRIEDLKRIDTQDKEAVLAYCEPLEKEKILKKIDTAAADNQTNDYAEVQKVVEEKENEITKLRQELENERAEKRKAEYTQFAEDLIRSGNITPAQKNVVIDLLEVCTQSGSYDFAEGDDKSVLNQFKALLKDCKQIEFAEIARKSEAGNGSITLDFSNPEKAAKIIADTAKEKGITEIEAKELLKGGNND